MIDGKYCDNKKEILKRKYYLKHTYFKHLRNVEFMTLNFLEFGSPKVGDAKSIVRSVEKGIGFLINLKSLEITMSRPSHIAEWNELSFNWRKTSLKNKFKCKFLENMEDLKKLVLEVNIADEHLHCLQKLNEISLKKIKITPLLLKNIVNAKYIKFIRIAEKIDLSIIENVEHLEIIGCNNVFGLEKLKKCKTLVIKCYEEEMTCQKNKFESVKRNDKNGVMHRFESVKRNDEKGVTCDFESVKRNDEKNNLESVKINDENGVMHNLESVKRNDEKNIMYEKLKDVRLEKYIIDEEINYSNLSTVENLTLEEIPPKKKYHSDNSTTKFLQKYPGEIRKLDWFVDYFISCLLYTSVAAEETVYV
jgi:hypothetical protein